MRSNLSDELKALQDLLSAVGSVGAEIPSPAKEGTYEDVEEEEKAGDV